MRDVQDAKSAFEESVCLKKSPWALRNLSMIYKNEIGDAEIARDYILSAFEIKKTIFRFAKNSMQYLPLVEMMNYG